MASFSYSNARAGSGLFALGGGDTLPFVPRAVLRVDHASSVRVQLAQQDLQLTAAGGLSWLGPRPLPLGETSASVWQLDLALRGRWRWLELGVSLENVFDVRNRVAELNYASNFAGDDAGGAAASMRALRHFAAGMPRTWWLSLKIRLDDSAGPEAT
jgi:iron complex outermembrane receptor protein